MPRTISSSGPKSHGFCGRRGFQEAQDRVYRRDTDHAAAATGLDLIDVPYLDLENEAGLDAAAAAAAAALGMTGKAAIHPRQIPVINRRFTPTAAAITHAQRVIDAFEAGDGGLVVVDGKLIEKPVLRAMYRVLAIADRVGG